MSPKSNPFNKKTTLLEDFRVFKRLCFPVFQTWQLQICWLRFLLVSALALGYSSRIPPATWPSGNQVPTPPKKGPPPFWSSYGCCSCWTPVNSPIARKGSGNLPIISRVWDSEGFLNPSVCWFFRNISETLRAQHFLPIWTHVFFARFFSIGGCEVGFLKWLIIFQVIQAVTQLDPPNGWVGHDSPVKGSRFHHPQNRSPAELPGLSDSNKLVY